MKFKSIFRHLNEGELCHCPHLCRLVPVLLVALLFVAFLYNLPWQIILKSSTTLPPGKASSPESTTSHEMELDNEIRLLNSTEARYHLDDLFVPLSVAEIHFLFKLAELHFHCKSLQQVASLRDNFVWSFDIFTPDKKSVLSISSSGHLERRAKAVIFNGDSAVPEVTEYVITFPQDLVVTTQTNLERLATISFVERPRNSPEQKLLHRMIRERLCPVFWTFMKVHLHKELLDHTCYILQSPCACLKTTFATPLVFTRAGEGRRKTWFRFHKRHSPFVQHPLDFQFLIDHTALDDSQWMWEKVWSGGKMYSPDSFKKTTESLPAWENVSDSRIPPEVFHFYKEMHRRKKKRFSDFFPFIGVLKPTEPITDRLRVEYRNWTFLLSHHTETGLRLYDIRFYSRRIVHELGLMEALTQYTGETPFFKVMLSLESTYLMGNSLTALRRGQDCPHHAKYLTLTLPVEGGTYRVLADAVCLFQWYGNSGSPMGRHEEFNEDWNSAEYFYAFGNRNLVVRSVLTLFNYDYILDYVFYASGAVKVHLSPSGLIHVDLVEGGETMYAPAHVHLFHFKVDVDLGTAQHNHHRVKFLTSPSGGDSSKLFVLEEKFMKRERDQLNWEKQKDVQHLICDEQPSNIPSLSSPLAPSNTSACYKIINGAPVGNPILPHHLHSLCWTRHPFIVTAHRDNRERSSSSVYNGVNLLRPRIQFCDFFTNNDAVYNTDVVAWVALGVHHIPRNEDLPNTQTIAGRPLAFHLIPNNFFTHGVEMLQKEQFYHAFQTANATV